MATADKLTTIIANNTAIQGYVDNSLAAVAAKGVTVADSDKLEQLPGLIASIEAGGTSGTSQFYLNKCVLTVDDGYQIERIPINAGDTIDLGSGEDVAASTNWGSYYHAKSHPAMTFTSWTSSIGITNNTFVVPDDICTDYHVGAIYKTTDGKSYGIRYVQVDGYVCDEYASGIPTNLDYVTSCWLGDSVTSIGEYAFEGCTSLTTINIPSTVTSIGIGAFADCTSLTSISIPSTVTSILDTSFNYCTSLTTINIPSTVTSILDMSFNYCTSLTTINIPSTVTSIGIGAFADCTSLTSISIFSLYMNYAVFYECVNLIIMVLSSSVPPIMEDTSIFSGCQCTFLVPVGLVDTYEAATNWSSFAGRFLENTEENRKKFGIWGGG